MTPKAVDMIQRLEAPLGQPISRRHEITAVEIVAADTPAPDTPITPLVNPKTTRHSFEDFLTRLFHASSAVDWKYKKLGSFVCVCVRLLSDVIINRAWITFRGY